MRLSTLASDSKTLASSLPSLLPGGKTGTLLLHGFTGTPRDLAKLAERLNDSGFTVSLPRLPGHGTNASDFMQSGWRDWLRAATDAWMNLAALCDGVDVVGYSMGGILAALCASRFPVRRLVLVAPALRTRNPLLPFSPLLSLFIRRIHRRIDPAHVPEDPDSQALSHEYWEWRFSRQSASLLRLQRRANRVLSSISADTFTIVGDADSAVPVSVVAYVEKHIGADRKEHLTIEGGSHSLFSEPHAQRVIDATVSWLTRPGAPVTVRT